MKDKIITAITAVLIMLTVASMLQNTLGMTDCAVYYNSQGELVYEDQNIQPTVPATPEELPAELRESGLTLVHQLKIDDEAEGFPWQNNTFPAIDVQLASMMNLKQIVATCGDLMFVLRPENGAWPEDHLEVLEAYMEIVLVTTPYTRDFVSDSVYPLLDHLASMQAHCVTDLLCYAYPMDYILVKANHFSQQELYDFLFGEDDENPAIMYL